MTSHQGSVTGDEGGVNIDQGAVQATKENMTLQAKQFGSTCELDDAYINKVRFNKLK